jgi:hypothetical protein
MMSKSMVMGAVTILISPKPPMGTKPVQPAVSLTLTRTGDLSSALTVNYTVGTATLSSDYNDPTQAKPPLRHFPPQLPSLCPP